MKPGEKVVCPVCSEECFTKVKPVLDGWNKIGEMLVCSLCETKICDYCHTHESSVNKQSNAKTAALSDLLGGVEIDKPEFTVSDKERQFCRDCQHFVVHPFLSRCDLHDKNVNPMDDCSDFKQKSKL